MRNFNCQKSTSDRAPFLIGIARSCRLFMKKVTLAQVFSLQYWEIPILENDCEGFK